jgi:signal peptidase II
MIVAVIGIALDQLTKLWALLNLSESANFELIPQVLNLKLIFNQGISFSWLPGAWQIPATISVIVVILLGVLVFKFKCSPSDLIILGALMAGISGNLIDRFFRPDHSVIDFIQYFNWVTGNLADVFIVLSIPILLIRPWSRSLKKDSAE